MFTRMIHFQTQGDKKAEALGIMDTLLPKIRQQKGCKDCMFLMHDQDHQYVLLVFWESKEAADNAAGVIGPLMKPALNKISTEPVQPLLYEVYRPMTMEAN